MGGGFGEKRASEIRCSATASTAARKPADSYAIAEVSVRTV